jgi:hypothetical protein
VAAWGLSVSSRTPRNEAWGRFAPPHSAPPPHYNLERRVVLSAKHVRANALVLSTHSNKRSTTEIEKSPPGVLPAGSQLYRVPFHLLSQKGKSMHREIAHRINESNSKLIEPPAPSAAEIIGLEVCVARAFAQSCPNCGGCEARIEPGKAQSYAAIRCLRQSVSRLAHKKYGPLACTRSRNAWAPPLRRCS